MTLVQTSQGWRSSSFNANVSASLVVFSNIIVVSMFIVVPRVIVCNSNLLSMAWVFVSGSNRILNLQFRSLLLHQHRIALGTEFMLALQIAMLRADGKGRGDGDIG